MSSYHSYPKIYNMGHPQIRELFDSIVTIEEKIDGSQFSFGIFDGELKCRSKGKEIVIDAPEKMFNQAVETIKELAPVIKEQLFKWAWPKVARAIVGGLPQWYKEELAKAQFGEDSPIVALMKEQGT
jgi:hypothetical protein